MGFQDDFQSSSEMDLPFNHILRTGPGFKPSGYHGKPCPTLLDYFAINADGFDVATAYGEIVEEMARAGVTEFDLLTVRCQARYRVAERMIRVRDEL